MIVLTVVRGLLSARACLVLAILIASAVMPASRSRAQPQDCEYGAFGCGHAEQHHQYQEWKPSTGKGSCCNGEDCRPVKARGEDDGSWSVWIPEFRRWVRVPAFAVGEPDRFGDGRSHVCSTKPLPALPVFHIFCFSPTGSKS
jgi:hypothetical protein